MVHQEYGGIRTHVCVLDDLGGGGGGWKCVLCFGVCMFFFKHGRVSQSLDD